MGVGIPAPSEGREGGATECTQASADDGVALKEWMRMRAIGEVPENGCGMRAMFRRPVRWVALAAWDGM